MYKGKKGHRSNYILHDNQNKIHSIRRGRERSEGKTKRTNEGGGGEEDPVRPSKKKKKKKKKKETSKGIMDLIHPTKEKGL
jgi:hypothetical protein